MSGEGMIAEPRAVHGDAAGARVHAYQRAAGWMADRAAVDPTGRVMLGVTRAFTEALGRLDCRSARM